MRNHKRYHKKEDEKWVEFNKDFFNRVQGKHHVGEICQSSCFCLFCSTCVGPPYTQRTNWAAKHGIEITFLIDQENGNI